MDLKNQVVSLELAKKLKELGIKQESYFYWFHCKHHKPAQTFVQIGKTKTKNGFTTEELSSAFTVAELGEMLPFGFSSYSRHNGEWECFDNRFSKLTQERYRAETEAGARAEMLIYLLESRLVTKIINN